MFKGIANFFNKIKKIQEGKENKESAKERLHLVLLQDRANVSADFLDMMKQEIIEVIKKYIDIDENEMDVKLTNKQNSDGTTGAPALYANIPIVAIKDETRKMTNKLSMEKSKKEENKKENNEKNKSSNAETKETEKQVNKKEEKKESKLEEEKESTNQDKKESENKNKDNKKKKSNGKKK